MVAVDIEREPGLEIAQYVRSVPLRLASKCHHSGRDGLDRWRLAGRRAYRGLSRCKSLSLIWNPAIPKLGHAQWIFLPALGVIVFSAVSLSLESPPLAVHAGLNGAPYTYFHVSKKTQRGKVAREKTTSC